LSVSAVNRLSDQGWYTCDARDSTGQGMRRSVYVSVMGQSLTVLSLVMHPLADLASFEGEAVTVKIVQGKTGRRNGVRRKF